MSLQKIKDLVSMTLSGQNVERVLGNSAHLLYADAGRRFRFSVTIENTSMRLWFISRGACIVSKPFDFVRVRDTIPLILAMI